jgi:ubiquinone/menaquinone biosynthesis C-methylase UbiE
MLPKDMEHYFSEIDRVLKKNGRCFITFFLLNDESRALIDPKSSYNFQYKHDGYQTGDQAEPETGVAYEEKDIRKLYEKTGFDIVTPIHYGSWCGRKETMFQDFVVARKKRALEKELKEAIV